MKKKMMIKHWKNYKVFASMALVYLFAVSCNEIQEHHADESISTHNQAEHSNAVTLNNNGKWQANEETNRGITNMMRIVKNEKTNGLNSDCKTMQSQLSEEFDQILQKCTMTGEAHNQLHNYLMPLSAQIERLDIVDDTECSTSLDNLEGYLTEYSDYFE